MATVLVLLDTLDGDGTPSTPAREALALGRRVATLAGAACFAAVAADDLDALPPGAAAALGALGADRVLVVAAPDLGAAADDARDALRPLLTLLPDTAAGRALVVALAARCRDEAGPPLRLAVPARAPARARVRRRDETTRVGTGTGARLVPTNNDARRWPLEVLVRPLIATAAAEPDVPPPRGRGPARLAALVASPPTLAG